MKNIVLSIIMLLALNGISAERITINPAESRSITWNVLQCHDDFTIVEVLLNYF